MVCMGRDIVPYVTEPILECTLLRVCNTHVFIFFQVVGVGDIAEMRSEQLTLETELSVGSASTSASSWDTTPIDDSWWYVVQDKNFCAQCYMHVFMLIL